MRITGLHKIFDAKTSTGSPFTAMFQVGQGSTLRILHDTGGSGLSTGAQVNVAFCTDSVGTVAIDSGDSEIGSAKAADNAAVIPHCTEWVKFTLAVTDGTHSVYAEVHDN